MTLLVCRHHVNLMRCASEPQTAGWGDEDNIQGKVKSTNFRFHAKTDETLEPFVRIRKIQCLLAPVSNHYLPMFSKTASCLVSCRTCNFNGGKMSNWSFVALTYNLLVRSHELQEMDQLSFGTWEVNLVKEVVPA